MLTDADKLLLLFELLDELSSAKGHAEHYKELAEERRKQLQVRWNQLQSAMALLNRNEFGYGFLGTCCYCHCNPHMEKCELKILNDRLAYSAKHGVDLPPAS